MKSIPNCPYKWNSCSNLDWETTTTDYLLINRFTESRPWISAHFEFSWIYKQSGNLNLDLFFKKEFSNQYKEFPTCWQISFSDCKAIHLLHLILRYEKLFFPYVTVRLSLIRKMSYSSKIENPLCCFKISTNQLKIFFPWEMGTSFIPIIFSAHFQVHDKSVIFLELLSFSTSQSQKSQFNDNSFHSWDSLIRPDTDCFLLSYFNLSDNLFTFLVQAVKSCSCKLGLFNITWNF